MLKIKLSPNRDFLLKTWALANKVPGGKKVFSRAVGRMAPYTNTIGADVEELRAGYARLTMRDRPGIRNHLRSIHALALANFGEETSGIAMISQLEQGMRGIVTEINIEYLKKARGTLTAVSTAPKIVVGPVYARAEISDCSGDVVARFCATWLIGNVSES